MRVFLVNQAFHPDVVSSGQHLSDLAVALSKGGNEVTVVTSRRAYDNPTLTFPKREVWQGIKVFRVFNTGFGKRAKWRRAMDSLTFLVSCGLRLCFLPRPDVIVALTSPPLVSVIAALVARLRGAAFCYWIMDLNPDEAIAAGWLAKNSLVARWLEALSRFSLRSARTVIVLDKFMEARISAKGIAAEKISVIPPWSHDADVHFDPEGRDNFRKLHGLEGKFVVMYAGNHSPCHPLDTVLAAARKLADQKSVAFCFVGGGSEHQRVNRFARENQLSNVLCLPYQPLNQLAGVLSAADLHLVVMGEPFVGLVHPCKAYNLLRIQSPILYMGPRPSHISNLLEEINGRLPSRLLPHGDPDRTAEVIREFHQSPTQLRGNEAGLLSERFSMDALLPRMVKVIRAAGQKQV